MASGSSTHDDEIFRIAITVELDLDTVNRLRAVFPGVAPEDAIAGLVEFHMADAEEINRKDGR